MKYLITWIAWGIFFGLSIYCRRQGKKWLQHGQDIKATDVVRARARVAGGEWQEISAPDAVLAAKLGCFKYAEKWSIYATVCSLLALGCIILGLFST